MFWQNLSEKHQIVTIKCRLWYVKYKKLINKFETVCCALNLPDDVKGSHRVDHLNSDEVFERMRSGNFPIEGSDQLQRIKFYLLCHKTFFTVKYLNANIQIWEFCYLHKQRSKKSKIQIRGNRLSLLTGLRWKRKLKQRGRYCGWDHLVSKCIWFPYSKLERWSFRFNGGGLKLHCDIQG